MAAQGLLPLFHESQAEFERPSETDELLAELLGGAGEDLLASLLEPSSDYCNQLSPSLTSPPFAPPLATATSAHPPPDISAGGSLDGWTNVGCRSQTPLSYSSGSPREMLGNSLDSGSPSDAMCLPSSAVQSCELGVLLESIGSGGSFSDVKIDVDGGPREAAGSSEQKAPTIILTEEEKQLLSAEGVELPTDLPLTKAEQKHLKKVRRKIKNKLSAQESRRKKKEYVEGLEERVESCTNTNSQLRQRVQTLEAENKSLLHQLQRLQSVVAQINPSKLQAGSLLMALSLCFSLLIWPSPPSPLTPPHATSVQSRSLLFTETDEFGNIIDPESGAVVSEQGGLTPWPPYPWSQQTPAFLSLRN